MELNRSRSCGNPSPSQLQYASKRKVRKNVDHRLYPKQANGERYSGPATMQRMERRGAAGDVLATRSGCEGPVDSKLESAPDSYVSVAKDELWTDLGSFGPEYGEE